MENFTEISSNHVKYININYPPAPAPPPATRKAAPSAPRFDSGGRLAYAAVEASLEASSAQLDRRGATPQGSGAAPLGGGGGKGAGDDPEEDGSAPPAQLYRTGLLAQPTISTAFLDSVRA